MAARQLSLSPTFLRFGRVRAQKNITLSPPEKGGWGMGYAGTPLKSRSPLPGIVNCPRGLLNLRFVAAFASGTPIEFGPETLESA